MKREEIMKYRFS